MFYWDKTTSRGWKHPYISWIDFEAFCLADNINVCFPSVPRRGPVLNFAYLTRAATLEKRDKCDARVSFNERRNESLIGEQSFSECATAVQLFQFPHQRSCQTRCETKRGFKLLSLLAALLFLIPSRYAILLYKLTLNYLHASTSVSRERGWKRER